MRIIGDYASLCGSLEAHLGFIGTWARHRKIQLTDEQVDALNALGMQFITESRDKAADRMTKQTPIIGVGMQGLTLPPEIQELLDRRELLLRRDIEQQKRTIAAFEAELGSRDRAQTLRIERTT